MSILAEPRYKRKICVDPQNLKWKNDSSKFGQKMMEKMGWSEGKGLGVKEQGRTDNLKLKANWTQKGLRADSEKQNPDKTWISHHDEFSFLLEKLNKKKPENVEKESEEDKDDDSEEEEEPKTKKTKGEGKSIEETIRSKNKFFYRRVRMKDLSRYSEKDKSAVIGIRKKKEHQVEEPEVEAKEPTPEPENPQVKKSEVSINDYFAQKMAKFYAKKQQINDKPECEATPESPELNLEEKHFEESPETNLLDDKKRRKMEKKARKLAKTQLE